jgi:hypothetical protein
MDPTPPSRAAVGPSQNLWADVQALVDAMRTRWMTSVVGYDLRTQVGMLRKLAKLFAKRDAGDQARDAKDAAKGSGSIERYSKVALACLLVAGLVVGFILWRSRRAASGKGARAMSPEVAQAVKLYRELERVLAARGYAREPSSTPNEHAELLRASGFPYAREVREVTERYMQVRYGGANVLDAAELARLQAAIAKVKKAAPAQSKVASSR